MRVLVISHTYITPANRGKLRALAARGLDVTVGVPQRWREEGVLGRTDRKSTRLNSSHSQISYAVFCLKKKKEVARARLEILENAQRLLSRRVANRSRLGRAFDGLAEDVAARRLDPHAAARKLLPPARPSEK